MSKQFDKQFKENAVQYYLEHRDLGWNKCAENLGISRNAIRNWVKAAAENAGEVPTRGTGNYASDEEKENARLRKELRDCWTVRSWSAWRSGQTGALQHQPGLRIKRRHCLCCLCFRLRGRKFPWRFLPRRRKHKQHKQCLLFIRRPGWCCRAPVCPERHADHDRTVQQSHQQAGI